MLKSAIFSILFLMFCGTALSQDNPPSDSLYDINSLEFWKRARVMPVRFLEKSEDDQSNTRLSAIFASNYVLERINFILPVNSQKDAFFEQNNEWEEQIDRKRFLKRFMVIFLIK